MWVWAETLLTSKRHVSTQTIIRYINKLFGSEPQIRYKVHTNITITRIRNQRQIAERNGETLLTIHPVPSPRIQGEGQIVFSSIFNCHSKIQHYMDRRSIIQWANVALTFHIMRAVYNMLYWNTLFDYIFHYFPLVSQSQWGIWYVKIIVYCWKHQKVCEIKMWNSYAYEKCNIGINLQYYIFIL